MHDRRIVRVSRRDALVISERSNNNLVLFDAVFVPSILISERLRNFVQELCHRVHDLVFAHLLKIDQHDSGIVLNIAVELQLRMPCRILWNRCDPLACQINLPERIKTVADDRVKIEVNHFIQTRQ